MSAFQDSLWVSNFSEILQQQQLPPLELASEDGFFPATSDVIASKGEGRDLRKVCHNANERQRRKKLKALYETLRSLLPRTINKKIQSVPAVVCRVLKYIPELQNQIETLSMRRDRLLAIRKSCEEKAEMPPNPKRDVDFTQKEAVSLDVSVSVVATTEIVVTVQCLRTPVLLLSNLLALLEKERFDVLNAGTFVSDHMVWHTLHLKVMGSVEVGSLRWKILLVCKKCMHGGRISEGYKSN